jgi:hypothetical protein
MQGYKVKPSNNDDAVQVDVDLLKNHGFHDVIVYERQGRLRTVARFDDRLAAENQLADIQRYKASANIVDLAKWCSNTEDARKEIGTAPLNTCVSQ